MSSELIVVLVLIATAVGFVIWLRTKSHGYEEEGQTGKPAERSFKE
ncbi:MAG TPA: hypothetical protein VKN18_27400 [Blastocatellia bacterium]|nr:hypothetical protein [Blastocatellia bacterium]